MDLKMNDSAVDLPAAREEALREKAMQSVLEQEDREYLKACPPAKISEDCCKELQKQEAELSRMAGKELILVAYQKKQ